MNCEQGARLVGGRDCPTRDCDGPSDHASSWDRDAAAYMDIQELLEKGKARMIVDGKSTVICPGSIVYVPADTGHEFVDIEEDLALLVFFGSGGPSGAEI